MYYVKEETTQTYEEKKSKFIAYLTSYENFGFMMNRLREEHPKGRHFVYAYRYLNEFDQVVENSSDDGEPKGTSGKPSLNVLIGNELINTAVIVVRYFGGVKLGTGGLVRAYSDSINSVISSSLLELYEKLEEKILLCDYSDLSKIEYILATLDINIKSKEFSNNIKLVLEATNEKFILLSDKLPINIELT